MLQSVPLQGRQLVLIFSLPHPNAGVEHDVIIVLNNDGTKLLSHQWQSWCGVGLLVYGCQDNRQVTNDFKGLGQAVSFGGGDYFKKG